MREARLPEAGAAMRAIAPAHGPPILSHQRIRAAARPFRYA